MMDLREQVAFRVAMYRPHDDDTDNEDSAQLIAASILALPELAMKCATHGDALERCERCLDEAVTAAVTEY